MTTTDDGLRHLALDALFRDNPDPMFIIGVDGRFLAGNDALAARTGLPWDELVDHGFGQTVHPDDRELVEAEFAAALAGETRRYVSRGIRPDGSVFHASVINTPVLRDGEVVAVVAVAHDIDALTGERAALEARISAAFDGIRDVIAFVDPDWRITLLNQAATELFGRGKRDLVGTRLWDLQIPDPEGEAMLRDVMLTRRSRVRRRFDPHIARWMEVSGFPAGDLLGIQVRDVTELEEARRRIDDDSRLLHARMVLMEESRDAIVMRGLGDVIEYANRSAALMFDAGDPSDLVGLTLRDVLGLSDEDARRTESAMGREGIWTGDLVLRPRTGAELITENHWVTVDGPDGQPDAVFCIIRDVTELRRQEEMLLRTQRMESIGTLASGIAHDLNNVLTPLMLSTQLLAASESDPQRARLLEGMQQTIERGTAMIRQVLTFARGVEGERTPVDVAGLAQRFAEFCRDTLPKDVVVEVTVDDDLHVLGDPTQLLQVLMNLATNARDAMPGGGSLRLTATGRDESVTIEVADDGAGMEPEVLDRVFEPFYTTKGLGRGTGLGLPVSQAIARTHGGSLEASSTVGVGTVFRLELPRIDDDEIELTLPAEAPDRGLDGLRVLVVDDEDDIVEVATLVISGAGGSARGTSDAAEARRLLDLDGIDVVLTDLVMPGVSGRQFLDGLASAHPDVPVVAMSGVPEQGAHAARRTNVRATLDKPFTAQQLVAALRLAAGRS